MEVHFTPEQEAQLSQMATKADTDPARLVKDVLVRYLDDEARFLVNGVAVSSYGAYPYAPGGNLLFGVNNVGTENFAGNLSNAEIFTFSGTFTPSELESAPEPSPLALAFMGLGAIALAGGMRCRRATC
jgi:hypothetical protein